MNKIRDLACSHWIKNSEQIYDENFHISGPVIEAFEEGFKAAREMCANKFGHLDSGNHYEDMIILGDEEV